jgi:integrase
MMPKRHTWEDFTSQVLALYALPIRRVATQRKLRHVLEEFGAFCRTTDDLTPAAVAAWVSSHPDRRPATVESYLRSLRAACVYGTRWGHMRASPFDFRSPVRWVDWDVPELPPPVHTAEEIARVLELADREAPGGTPLAGSGAWKASRLRAVVYAFAFTGARRRELLALAVADVDLEGQTIRIATNARRSLKTRSAAAQIPVAAPLAAVLAGWIPQCGSTWIFPGIRRRGPWLEGSVGEKALDQVKALGIRAGVEGLTFQSFRHTFASLSEGWGVGELALQRILRHSNLRTQRGYRHPLPEVLRGAASKVHFP